MRLIPIKLRAVWHVLRGRPLVYRVSLEAGPGVINFAPGSKNIYMVESSIHGRGISGESGVHLHG